MYEDLSKSGGTDVQILTLNGAPRVVSGTAVWNHLLCKVCFHGRISEAELDGLYANADVFVLPSLWEGYGIVLLEAMAHGLSIIATSVGVIPELVRHGENGWLVPPGDSHQLAEAILTIAGDRELGGRMGRAGRKRVEQLFSIESNVQEIEKVYRDLLGQESPGEVATDPEDLHPIKCLKRGR